MVHFVTFEGIQPISTGPVAEGYFNSLLPHLLQSPGYESFAYYAHITDATRGLLVATFKDEEAIRVWQRQSAHLDIQRKARAHVYDDYRIRIGGEVATGENERLADIASEPAVLLYKLPVTGDEDDNLAMDVIPRTENEAITDERVYRDDAAGAKISISGWASTSAALDFAKAIPCESGIDIHVFHVERDYTKLKREDAPKNDDD